MGCPGGAVGRTFILARCLSSCLLDGVVERSNNHAVLVYSTSGMFRGIRFLFLPWLLYMHRVFLSRNAPQELNCEGDSLWQSHPPVLYVLEWGVITFSYFRRSRHRRNILKGGWNDAYTDQRS